MSLSQKLKDLRKAKGLSQAALADILGLTQQAIGKWERNKAMPDYDTLKKIASYFNVTTDYLIGSESMLAPPPEFYTDPETQQRMKEIMEDPTRKRIFIASKDLKPEELDRIADLMETMAKSRSKE